MSWESTKWICCFLCVYKMFFYIYVYDIHSHVIWFNTGHTVLIFEGVLKNFSLCDLQLVFISVFTFPPNIQSQVGDHIPTYGTVQHSLSWTALLFQEQVSLKLLYIQHSQQNEWWWMKNKEKTCNISSAHDFLTVRKRKKIQTIL